MASKDVIFEEFPDQLQPTTAAIYVLDKTLYDYAVDLKEFLTQPCDITICEYWKSHLGYTIADTYAKLKKCIQEECIQPEEESTHKKSTDTYKVDSRSVSIRGYGYLESLITKAKNKSRNDIGGLYHDVIIILGHSSVLLAEDKDLIEAFAKIDPTIIAFLGCCGGNTRYGPILTMSYLLPAKHRWHEHPPIIGFYRRQVYKKELKYTSLMIGLQYYLHLIECYKYENGETALCAFALAKFAKSVSPIDPTVFIEVGENLFKGRIIMEKPPLSCLQLALYNPIVVSNELWSTESEKHLRSCPNHMLVNDILQQLNCQKINITITLHGNIKKNKIKITDKQELKVFGTSLKEITITEVPEDPKDKQWSWTEVKNLQLQGIKITFKALGKRKICEDPKGIQITFQQWIVVVKNLQGVKISFCYPCRMVSQDDKTILVTTDERPPDGRSWPWAKSLNEICWEKIEELQLHKIIPLICEIKFIKLFENTLELLRSGDKKSKSWKDIDPLQFLVAVHRGHWGKNSLTDIKIWATYHLKKCMSDVNEGNLDDLHQYKLCCICFVLLFEDSFVRFVESTDKDYHQYDIIVCTKEENKLEDIDNSPQTLPESPIAPFPPDKDLLSCWADLLQDCKPIIECVDLFNKDEHPEWVIGNRYGPEQVQQENLHSYKYKEFLLAMGALSDECQTRVRALINERHKSKETTICYHVSEFENKNNENNGRMKCFNDDDPKDIDKIIVEELGVSNIEGVSFIETRLLLYCSKHDKKSDQFTKELFDLYKNDPAMWYLHVPIFVEEVALGQAAKGILLDQAIKLTKLDQAVRSTSCLYQALAQSIKNSLHQAKQDCTEANWHKVSSCRFVFAQFMTESKTEIKGILFYTETHYGHNLIEFNNEQLDKLKEKCTGERNCFKKLIDKLKELGKICEEDKVKMTTQKLADEFKMLFEQKRYGEWIELLKTPCKPCKYRMQQITIDQMKRDDKKTFPFVKVGRLTLTYNDNGQLTEIHLDKCAEIHLDKCTEIHLDKCAEHVATDPYPPLILILMILILMILFTIVVLMMMIYLGS